jgi:hypothetical protein
MKFVRIAGLCLASMLMMSMALVGTANATPLWLLCLEGKEGSLPTKYTTNQCTTAASENKGKWESVSIGTKSDTVRAVALSLRLEDAKGELGAAVIVKCPVVKGGGGLIEGNVLIVREARAPSPSTECTGEGTGLFKVCKTSSLEEVEGTNLPWKVEISASAGTYTGKIQPDGAGEPGWKVKCAGVEDSCLSEGAGTLEETSGTAGVVTAGVLLVLAKFKSTGKADCSVGGKEQGHVQGFVAILLSSGNGLSLHET